MKPASAYLDIAGAAAHLTALGFPTTERQMRRYADQKKLPFFHGLDGARYIAPEEIEKYLAEAQERARAAAPRRGKSALRRIA